MKNFVKKSELSLVNGGYLVTGENQNPVNNAAFVEAQRRAEYVVTFAELAKGKNFKACKVDSLESLVAQTNAAIAKSNPVKFVDVPDSTKGELTSKLAKEALDFMNGNDGVTKANKINNFLQEFTILKEFEEFGLFFEESVVKLTKIYTLAEVIEAATATVELI